MTDLISRRLTVTALLSQEALSTIAFACGTTVISSIHYWYSSKLYKYTLLHKKKEKTKTHPERHTRRTAPPSLPWTKAQPGDTRCAKHPGTLTQGKRREIGVEVCEISQFTRPIDAKKTHRHPPEDHHRVTCGCTRKSRAERPQTSGTRNASRTPEGRQRLRTPFLPAASSWRRRQRTCRGLSGRCGGLRQVFACRCRSFLRGHRLF